MKQRIQNTFSKFVWQPNRNIGPTLARALKRVIALRDGGLTFMWYTVLTRFGRRVELLVRTRGWRGAVIYLKSGMVLLQQAIGGQLLDNPRLLGSAVSRTRSGLPRLIPSDHRKKIRSGDAWTIRLWISLFWLYRVIDIPGTLNLASIFKPGKDNYILLLAFAFWLTRFMPVFLRTVGRKNLSNLWARSVNRSSENTVPLPTGARVTRSWLTSVAVHLYPKGWTGMTLMLRPRFLAILKSGPNSAKGPEEGPGPGTRTSIGSILTDAWVLRHSPDAQVVAQAINSLLALRPDANISDVLKESAQVDDEIAKLTSPSGMESGFHFEDGAYWSEKISGSPYSGPLPGWSCARGIGKLGLSEEPAGKVRVFAMVDSITQALMEPFHRFVFGLLGKIPQDGTFNQQRPAEMLNRTGIRTFWSFDLSAATDRFPMSVQQLVFGALFGPEASELWRSILVDRDYSVPRTLGMKGSKSVMRNGKKFHVKPRARGVPHGTPHSVRYNAGQPMGALTSWAVFSLSHHLLVQFSAYQATGRFEWFSAYALLGDDVVLANGAVAQKYLALLSAMEVGINLSKSLISTQGVFEFAKRTYRSGVDVSGISLDAVGAAVTDATVLEVLLEAANVRGIKNALRTSTRVLGYGFKTRARLPVVLETKSRLQGLALFLTRPRSIYGLPFDQWLLQQRVEQSFPLSRESISTIADGVAQRMLASIKVSLDKHRSTLLALERDPPLLNPAGTARIQVAAPQYMRFLQQWIISPVVDALRSEVTALALDLKELTKATGGEVSLNENYFMINDLLTKVSALRADVDVLRRKEVQKNRQSTLMRSKMLKLWRASHKLVQELSSKDESRESMS